METPCTVCGQTSTDPGRWGANSLTRILEDAVKSVIPMTFKTCDECQTAHVCPDCLHERHCCEALQEAGD